MGLRTFSSSNYNRCRTPIDTLLDYIDGPAVRCHAFGILVEEDVHPQLETPSPALA